MSAPARSSRTAPSAPARSSRTQQVVDAITAMVLDGRLAPGDRLPVESDLAAELGVSRGPLREGVRALSVLGVLETRQGAGTYVTALDPSGLVGPLGLMMELQAGHAVQVHAVRRMLETEAAGLAAARSGATPGPLDEARTALADFAAALAEPDVDHERLLTADLAFHRAVAAAAGNPVLSALVEALAGRTARHRLRRGVVVPGADERTHTQHEAILAAVVDGDVDRARVRMSAHLLEVEDSLTSAVTDREAAGR